MSEPDASTEKTIPVETPGPDDPFRNRAYQRGAPRPASFAAASLPVLGTVGAIATVALVVGSARGDLPSFGDLDSGNIILTAALLTISIWAVYLLWKVPQWQAAAWARNGDSNPRELFEIENSSRGTLGQILSGVAVLTGLIFAWQQLGQTSNNLRVSQEGQITDRFSRAVDQLGSEEFTIRLGGIYALERIARDSPRDYGPVMEVLTAFARQESPLPANAPGTPAVAAPDIPLDVKAVFKVIGRRTPEQVETEMAEGGCLDLTNINAVGADLADANLQNTCWDNSDLRGAIMSRANLADTTFSAANLQQANLDRVTATGAVFNSANLVFANLSQGDFTDANFLAANLTNALLQGANLTDASLLRANLQMATGFGADFDGADMLQANLTNAVLTDADLSEAKQLTEEQIVSAVTSAGTKLPAGIEATPDF
ncbi:MAG: pentapeptide repeat-containing protein [Thermomicrobiales bacterium]